MRFNGDPLLFACKGHVNRVPFSFLPLAISPQPSHSFLKFLTNSRHGSHAAAGTVCVVSLLFKTRKRHQRVLRSPCLPLGVDLLLLVALAGVAGGIILFGERLHSPFTEKVDISLSY